jgi:hypothetical protein
LTELFADRLAAVRRRFMAKLDGRLDELEAAVPELTEAVSIEVLARVHRRAHDLCGVGPTMGFVATGKAARTVEQLLLAPLKAGRTLTGDELAQLRHDIAVLRSVATAETPQAGQE